MRKTIATLIFSLCVTGICRSDDKSIDFASLVRIVAASDKSISKGTGFVYGPNCNIATASHVISGNEVLFAAYYQITNNALVKPPVLHPLTKLYVVPKHDLAVLHSDNLEVPNPVTLGDIKTVRPGDIVKYVGWNEDVKRYRCEVVTVTAVGTALKSGICVDFIEFGGGGRTGYSGGPVFNKEAEIIGIITEGWENVDAINKQPIGKTVRAFSINLLNTIEKEVELFEFKKSTETEAVQNILKTTLGDRSAKPQQ